jgi:putative ABC transport system permease protein
MIDIIRNLARRKFRTFLTILGIVAGALALTVMGALSEKLNMLFKGAVTFYNTRIIVQPRAGVPGLLFGPTLSMGVLDTIRKVPGVSAAFPTTYMLLRQEKEEGAASVTLGMPSLVVGMDARRFQNARVRDTLVVLAGRLFQPGEHGLAVLGSDLAQASKIAVGGTFKADGRNFRVLGILERTLTVRDNMVFIPLADAQALLAAYLPAPFASQPEMLVSEIEVYPDDLAEAGEIADIINSRIKGVRAVSPGEIERRFRQNLVIFNVIAISSAAIALVVGSLAILNTMVMAVSERAGEIGIKKAIGATNVAIAKEFLGEAAIMGIIGGILGLASGAMLVFLLNNSKLTQGVVIFLITPRLIVFVLVFSVFLGAGAGLYPALRAARRSPVEALRAV